MELEWRSCENGWCDLRIVKLGWSSGKGGVYIIWSGKGVFTSAREISRRGSQSTERILGS